MRIKLFLATLTVMALAVPAHAGLGYCFYGLGAVGNPSNGLVEVQQQFLPQATMEWGYPVAGPVSAGFEVSGVFFQSRTQRWGSEYDFGAALGAVVTVDMGKRWFVTTGGGWLLSNPLSDEASGEYLEGNEGNPGARMTRKPIHPAYVRGTIGFRLNRNWAIQAGVRNTSPYLSIGFSR